MNRSLLLALNAFYTQQLTYTTTSLRRSRSAHYHVHRSTSKDHLEDELVFQGNRRLAFFVTLFTIYGSNSCSAVTAAYDEYASKYDDLDGGPLAKALGIDDARLKLIKNAKGRVLEVGAGTGLNINNYRFVSDSEPLGVTSLTLVDVSTLMLQQAQDKIQSFTNIPKDSIHLVVADATADLVKTFGVEQFDTVIDTFSLCVMGNDGALRCLKQMRDILKPGGSMLLLENTKSANKFLGTYQDWTSEAAATLGGKGCLYNQDTYSLISKTEGISLVSSETIAAGLFTSFICIKK